MDASAQKKQVFGSPSASIGYHPRDQHRRRSIVIATTIIAIIDHLPFRQHHCRHYKHPQQYKAQMQFKMLNRLELDVALFCYPPPDPPQLELIPSPPQLELIPSHPLIAHVLPAPLPSGLQAPDAIYQPRLESVLRVFPIRILPGSVRQPVLCGWSGIPLPMSFFTRNPLHAAGPPKTKIPVCLFASRIWQ